jgi:iron complex outermembrane receptor protein
MTGMAAMMMGPGTFQNIHNGQRTRNAFYTEWDANWNAQWSSQLGARYESVKMDTGLVQPYSWTQMMQMADRLSATAFNAKEHEQHDHNIDVTALLRFTPNETRHYEGGYARKTRSPNLYERYTWATGGMGMSMNGWFGDGNGYVGDIFLKPEVAHTFSATASWHNSVHHDWHIEATPYFTYIDNYIDAIRCSPTLGGGCTPANQTVKNTFVNLQFANQDAHLYGVDISGHMPLHQSTMGNFMANGVIGYVRGKNLTTGDNLYHIMPLNAKFTLKHQRNYWSNALELQAVAANHHVQLARNELRTAGYSLVNVRSSYEWSRLKLEAGVENLFNKNYAQPLGGAYLGERPFTWGNQVAGMGRSIYAGITLTF